MGAWKYLFSLLALLLALTGMAVVSTPDANLHLIVCDVGQGDGILVTYKSIQIVTDGGPANGKLLECLSRHMPFWDRTIELVILTNADLDHYGGLAQLFESYTVAKYLKPAVGDSTQSYQVLEKLVGSKAVEVLTPYQGLRLGYELIYLDILYPDEFSKSTVTNSQNNLSTVYTLSFGRFKALLTGDIEEEASDYLVLNSLVGDLDYIKIPHHGSRNGLTENLLSILNPELAVISAGKDNRYGHPHKEILEMLTNHNVKTLTTLDEGDVEVVTDRDSWWLVK